MKNRIKKMVKGCKTPEQLTVASKYLSQAYKSGMMSEYDNDELSRLIVSLYKDMDYDSENQFGNTC